MAFNLKDFRLTGRYENPKKGEYYLRCREVRQSDGVYPIGGFDILEPRPHDAAWAVERMLEGQVVTRCGVKYRIHGGEFQTITGTLVGWRPWIPGDWFVLTGFEVYAEPAAWKTRDEVASELQDHAALVDAFLDFRREIQEKMLKLEAGR